MQHMPWTAKTGAVVAFIYGLYYCTGRFSLVQFRDVIPGSLIQPSARVVHLGVTIQHLYVHTHTGNVTHMYVCLQLTIFTSKQTIISFGKHIIEINNKEEHTTSDVSSGPVPAKISTKLARWLFRWLRECGNVLFYGFECQVAQKHILLIFESVTKLCSGT